MICFSHIIARIRCASQHDGVCDPSALAVWQNGFLCLASGHCPLAAAGWALGSTHKKCFRVEWFDSCDRVRLRSAACVACHGAVRKRPLTGRRCARHDGWRFCARLRHAAHAGTFGKVVSAKRKADGVEVAIKCVVDDTGGNGAHFTALREIKVLRDVRHANIVALLDVFARSQKLFLVYELCPTDLWKIIQDKRYPLTAGYIKRYMWMALQGLQYLHTRWISHRDLKPNNLLVNARGELKIGDLGMSREWGHEGEVLSPQVVTRWYRAPELLFGARLYDGAAIDVWAMACILVEMYNRAPLLPGSSGAITIDCARDDLCLVLF